MVALLAPFVQSLPTVRVWWWRCDAQEEDIYFCFQTFMKKYVEVTGSLSNTKHLVHRSVKPPTEIRQSELSSGAIPAYYFKLQRLTGTHSQVSRKDRGEETDIEADGSETVGWSSTPNVSRMAYHIARLLTYFRLILPELCDHFDDEEVHPNLWVCTQYMRWLWQAVDWIRYLLAEALPLHCVLRLWDTYFAAGIDAVPLHAYVCLAILQLTQETLLEMEYSQILMFLKRLPPLDMDTVVTVAYAIRHKIREVQTSQRL